MGTYLEVEKSPVNIARFRKGVCQLWRERGACLALGYYLFGFPVRVGFRVRIRQHICHLL